MRMLIHAHMRAHIHSAIRTHDALAGDWPGAIGAACVEVR